MEGTTQNVYEVYMVWKGPPRMYMVWRWGEGMDAVGLAPLFEVVQGTASLLLCVSVYVWGVAVPSFFFCSVVFPFFCP